MQTDDDIVASAQRILLRRLRASKAKFSIFNSEDLNLYVSLQLGHLEHEEFGAIYLSEHNLVLRYYALATGSTNHCDVSVRQLVKQALNLNASGVIFVHNHPRATLVASDNDRLFTRGMVEALNPVDIEVYDHLIVCGQTVLSMKQSGDF